MGLIDDLQAHQARRAKQLAALEAEQAELEAKLHDVRVRKTLISREMDKVLGAILALQHSAWVAAQETSTPQTPATPPAVPRAPGPTPAAAIAAKNGRPIATAARSTG